MAALVSWLVEERGPEKSARWARDALRRGEERATYAGRLHDRGTLDALRDALGIVAVVAALGLCCDLPGLDVGDIVRAVALAAFGVA